MANDESLVAEQHTFTDFDLTIISVIDKQLKNFIDLDKEMHRSVAMVNEYYLFDGEDARININNEELKKFVIFILKRDKYNYRLVDNYVFIALNNQVDLDQIVTLFKKSRKSAHFLNWLSYGIFWLGIILGIICYFHFGLLYSQWFMLLAIILIIVGVGIAFCLRNGFIRFKAIDDYWNFKDMLSGSENNKNNL